MKIWKLLLVFFVIMFFHTLNSGQIERKDLQSAWIEVNQDKDIFQEYDRMKDEAFNLFLANGDHNQVLKLDLKIIEEEKRILKVQSLIENASHKELSLLIK